MAANSSFTIIVPPASPQDNRAPAMSSWMNKMTLVANSVIAYGNTEQTPVGGLYISQQYFNTDLQEKGTWNGSAFTYPAHTALEVAEESYGQANLVYGVANSAANTAAVYLAENLVIANAALDFNNSSSINVFISSASSGKLANVVFSVNTSAINANSGIVIAEAAYTQANLAYTAANTANSLAANAAVVGGLNNSIQYNANGSLAGSANLTYIDGTGMNLSSNLVVSGNGAFRNVSGYGATAGAQVNMTPDQGSFTGSLTGMTGTVNITCNWFKVGKVVTLNFTQTTGTSNTTAMILAGLPAELQPPTLDSYCPIFVFNNGAFVAGSCTVAQSDDIVFYAGVPGTAFTTSGAKGIAWGTITYLLD